jgi:nicotinamidase/pyrazinamidase
MTPVIFWDEDTQHDFMDPDGKLYVAGAEGIVPNLERLTRCARAHHVPIVAIMCDHTETDAEISATPDFQTTFPPHCIRGTRGQERIDATAPKNPLYVENRPHAPAELETMLRAHQGEIVIKKQSLDPFSNPATGVILNLLAPRTVVVYGVCTDFCVHQAVMRLSARGQRVCVAVDATQPINAEAAKRCEAEWQQLGVALMSTAEIVRAVERRKFGS